MFHVRARVLLLLLACSILGSAIYAEPTQVEAPETINTLVKKLTTPELAWEERYRAEKQLMTLPADEVMIALIPEIAEGRPEMHGGLGGTAIWNGTGSAEGDKRSLPPQVQVFYAIHRVWFAQNSRLVVEKGERLRVGRALVAYLPKARVKTVLLGELGSRSGYNSWVDEAEKPVAALFLDDATEPDVRHAALNCLLRNTGKKYYGEAKELAQAWPEQPWQQLNFKVSLVNMLMEADSRDRKGPIKEYWMQTF